MIRPLQPAAICRREKGLTLKQAAPLFGISFGHLSQVELGKSPPSLEVAFTMARFYDRSVEHLFGHLVPDLQPPVNRETAPPDGRTDTQCGPVPSADQTA